jgi:hypothetical protein
MSRKPAAALSASLVAVKGAAAPAPDMPGRGVPVAQALAGKPEASERPAPERAADGGLSPLNFRVPANFRREFKTFAARHDLKLNELLRRSFEAYRRTEGD